MKIKEIFFFSLLTGASDVHLRIVLATNQKVRFFPNLQANFQVTEASGLAFFLSFL